MKKFTQKKKNNKGFSLVELIVVIAIMAVLMVVLVPTLIKHVEKSRLQTDKSALAEIRQATITALADDKFALATANSTGATVGTDGKLTIAQLFADDDTSKALATEVESIIGSKTITLKSGIIDKGATVSLDFTAREGLVTLKVSSGNDKAEYSFQIDASGESALSKDTK